MLTLLNLIAQKKCDVGFNVAFVVCSAGSCKTSNEGQLLLDCQDIFGKDAKIKLFPEGAGFKFGSPVPTKDKRNAGKQKAN